MSTSINRNFSPWDLLKFAAPSIIMMVFMSLYTIVDGMFISRFVGSNALSSLNIVFPVINVAIAISTMLGTGDHQQIFRRMQRRRCQKSSDPVHCPVSWLQLSSDAAVPAKPYTDLPFSWFQ